MKIEGTSRNSSRLTVKEKKRKSFLRKKKKRVKVSFLVPSLATGHTSAGGALELSPPCLGFKLAAEVEGVGTSPRWRARGTLSPTLPSWRTAWSATTPTTTRRRCPWYNSMKNKSARRQTTVLWL